ncbi:type VI secretion system baseplate subunit TssK [Limnobacter thiooxidans]|uniref:Type VI secretion system baseplate subunit TssK n=1 Tax=Limnobacter thiooxidans TaxID=131080 RepID=A0AA86MJG5_9BURK|nr:type VI secretion system baseplate subunit TssK [Limnobacter thiooxidans]
MQLDADLLVAGRIGVLKATGYFPDGTYFSIPDKDPAPPCLTLASFPNAGKVMLSLANPHWHAPQLEWQENGENADKQARLKFVGESVEMPNHHDPELEPQSVDVARLASFLSVDTQHQEGHVQLQVCELLSSRNGEIRINEAFIEPCLCSLQNSNIRRVLDAVLALLESKISQLRQRRIRKGSHNSSEIGDFLLLQACVQHRLIFAHLLGSKQVHPEAAYLRLLACLGSVTLYGDDSAADFSPSYNHDNLRLCFDGVLTAIRNALAGLHDQHAIQIPLTPKPGGIHIGQITDRTLVDNAHFYLSVHALAPEELIQRQLPSTVKIGPVEKLRDLVNLNLPGVRLKSVQQSPAALPHYADHLCFQLETRAEPLWKLLEQTGHLAIHYAGDLPELRLELWAVRREQERLL